MAQGCRETDRLARRIAAGPSSNRAISSQPARSSSSRPGSLPSVATTRLARSACRAYGLHERPVLVGLAVLTSPVPSQEHGDSIAPSACSRNRLVSTTRTFGNHRPAIRAFPTSDIVKINDLTGTTVELGLSAVTPAPFPGVGVRLKEQVDRVSLTGARRRAPPWPASTSCFHFLPEAEKPLSASPLPRQGKVYR